MSVNLIPDDSPCKDCAERFPACSGRCPKEARGERGYDTWVAQLHDLKEKYAAYVKQHNEDYKRSETYDWKRKKRGSGR